MAKDESVISASGYFDGQTSRGNFDVQLKAKFAPEELANVENEKVKLGQFNVYTIRIDRDANCFVTFKSNVDSSYVENFSQLMVDEAVITFKAKIIAEE